MGSKMMMVSENGCQSYALCKSIKTRVYKDGVKNDDGVSR